MAAPTETPGVTRSIIPARIDRLPWSPFHTHMVVALGVAWILDGLEITPAPSVKLTTPGVLRRQLHIRAFDDHLKAHRTPLANRHRCVVMSPARRAHRQTLRRRRA
jgi:hypothetical protein